MLRLSCLKFFYGQAVAHYTLLMILKLSPASGENSGFKRQACSAPFVPSSVLGLAMTSIMNLRYSVLLNLIDNFMVLILHSGSCPCSYLWRILLQTSTEISKLTRVTRAQLVNILYSSFAETILQQLQQSGVAYL